MKFLILLLIFVPLKTFAEVYTWTDEKGVTHYSTTKENNSAKPAELPKITRGEVKLADSMLESCLDHGGIDCTMGPDEDGSVICQDGFRDAAARFLFNCKTTKIVLSDISDLNETGKFSIFYRNKKAVLAKNVIVKYIPKDGTEIILEGPKNIQPYEVAEYVLDGMYLVNKESKPQKSDFVLICENCP